jgi:hypothetical protein
MFIVRRNLAAIEAGADPLHERGAALSPALPLSRSPALPLSRSPALPLSRSPALPLSRSPAAHHVAESVRIRAAARLERNSFRSVDQQVVISVGNGLRAVPRSANRLRFPGHASAKARPRFTPIPSAGADVLPATLPCQTAVTNRESPQGADMHLVACRRRIEPRLRSLLASKRERTAS